MVNEASLHPTINPDTIMMNAWEDVRIERETEQLLRTIDKHWESFFDLLREHAPVNPLLDIDPTPALQTLRAAESIRRVVSSTGLQYAIYCDHQQTIPATTRKPGQDRTQWLPPLGLKPDLSGASHTAIVKDVFDAKYIRPEVLIRALRDICIDTDPIAFIALPTRDTPIYSAYLSPNVELQIRFDRDSTTSQQTKNLRSTHGMFRLFLVLHDTNDRQFEKQESATMARMETDSEVEFYAPGRLRDMMAEARGTSVSRQWTRTIRLQHASFNEFLQLFCRTYKKVYTVTMDDAHPKNKIFTTIFQTKNGMYLVIQRRSDSTQRFTITIKEGTKAHDERVLRLSPTVPIQKAQG